MPYRVLPGGGAAGQVILVDAAGGGDYASIQAAILAARGQAPAADNRWLVLVAPGVYREGLTLYDYIDISGLAPVPGAFINAPAAAINNAADCWLSNLRLAGGANPVVQAGGGSGELTLENVSIHTTANQVCLAAASATVTLRRCSLRSAGTPLTGDDSTLRVFDSRLEVRNEDPALGSPPVVRLGQGGLATFEGCSLLHLADYGAGGPAVHLTGDAPPGLAFKECILRRSAGDYTVRANFPAVAEVLNCLLNAPLDPLVSGPYAGNTVVDFLHG